MNSRTFGSLAFIVALFIALNTHAATNPFGTVTGFNPAIVLLYDRAAGELSINYMDRDPVNPDPVLQPSGPRITNWGKTWSHIVPGHFSNSCGMDFLFYDESSGVAEFYNLSLGPPVMTLLKRYTDWSPGTTHIVPGNFGGSGVTGHTDLLLYNATSGSGGFFDVWGQANMNAMKGYSNWRRGWSHIVPGNFGGTSATGQSDLLFHNADTGFAQFYDVWGQANLALMQSYPGLNPGTTHITAGNFGGTNTTGQSDLLLYDAASGSAGFWEVWGHANVFELWGYPNWSPNITHIVPGNFGGTSVTGQTDLLIHKGFVAASLPPLPSVGAARFYDVSGQGNINLMKYYISQNWDDRWSLIVTTADVAPIWGCPQ